MARRGSPVREPGHKRRTRKARGFAAPRTDPEEGLADVDLAVKEVLPRSPMLMSRIFGNIGVKVPLNSEMANFRKGIVDFVAIMDDDSIGHLEYQLRNHPRMPLRMFHYEGLIRSTHGMKRVLRQAVVYVGDEVPNDPGGIVQDDGEERSKYLVVDLKSLPARDYLDSENVDDALVGLLARHEAGGAEAAIDQLHERILRLPKEDRLCYVRQLAIASGLRGLAAYARRKAPMALSQTYELLAEQEPFRGMIATGKEEGERAGNLKGLKSAVVTFLKKKGVALDDVRATALGEFDDEERLKELVGDLVDAPDPEAVLAAFDRIVVSSASSADTLGDTNGQRP